MSFIRDPSGDVIYYDAPATLYSDTSTITVGKTLYDNTGTLTNFKVGTINPDNTFDLAPTKFYGIKLGSASQSGDFYFASTPTPAQGDLVYDLNGDVVEGAYFNSDSYVHLENINQSYTNASDYIYFSVNDSDWNFVGTPATGSYRSEISIYASDLTIPLYASYTSSNLITNLTGTVNCGYSFSCTFHKSVKTIILHCSDWFNSDPITTYTNCTVHQDNKNPSITPLDYSQTVSATYFNDC